LPKTSYLNVRAYTYLDVTQWAEEKSRRAEFIGLVNEFYSELTNICLRLKGQPNEDRKSKLQLFLRKAFARHLLKSNMHGVFFPVADSSNFVSLSNLLSW